MIGAIKRITIDARPEALTIEPARTAIIVVDMQNDFGAHGGMMELAGINISGNRAVIPATSRVLAAARQAGIVIVYLKMAFRADLSDAGAPDAPTGSSICHYVQARKQRLRVERQVVFWFAIHGTPT